MKKLLKIFNTRNSSAGFTLIELLVAASITTIVVSLAGTGMVAITENNKKAKAETERRVELNRALDFISDEVRQATPIATNASTNLATVAPDFSSLDKTPVLTLKIPGVNQRVIYYIASSTSTSPWLGPKVISRWGPSFLANGTYSNPTSPASWQGQPLVDLIADTTTASTTPCSTTDWTANPSVNNGQGFTACVDPNGRIADIRLRGKLTDAYGTSRPPFEVSTKVFARPSTPTFTTGSGGGGGLCTGTGCGTITLTEPSTAYLEVLGGSMYCDATVGEIPTTTTLNVRPTGGPTKSTTLPSSSKTLNVQAAAGTTITVTGFANNSVCYGLKADETFNSETNKNTQVKTLRNGDTPPLFAPYGTQPTIDTFLLKYLDANGKIKIAENQVIYLFELFTRVPSEPTYDMQDLVVLATITPQ